jgi:hypothetical protein
MRRALAPKVEVAEGDTAVPEVVKVDTAVAEAGKAAAEGDMVVAEAGKVVAGADEGLADEDQGPAVDSNHRSPPYITMMVQNFGAILVLFLPEIVLLIFDEIQYTPDLRRRPCVSITRILRFLLLKLS